MSLKHFHVIFIAIAVLLCVGFGAWTFLADSDQITALIQATGIFSLILAAVLAVYGIWFYRKSKKVIT